MVSTLDSTIYEKLQLMPQQLKTEILDFMDYLWMKYQKQNNSSDIIITQKKQRQWGQFAGKIKIADDFDAPLDDFKEYM